MPRSVLSGLAERERILRARGDAGRAAVASRTVDPSDIFDGDSAARAGLCACAAGPAKGLVHGGDENRAAAPLKLLNAGVYCLDVSGQRLPAENIEEVPF